MNMSSNQNDLDEFDRKILGDINQYAALINQRLDLFIEAHGLNVVADKMSKHLQSPNERILPLGSAAAQCKGKKAVAVVLPSGERVETSTWKKAAAAIMRDCDADPQRHEMLMELREGVPCRFRQMLSGTPKGMDAPLKINDGLYLESKFDTEALLTNLTQKILRRVGYNYGGVMILYRDRKMEIAAESKQEKSTAEPEQYEGISPPTGLMM